MIFGLQGKRLLKVTNLTPDFIVHYSRGEPFLSMSEVSQESLPEVLCKLDEHNSWGLNRFSDPEYLPRRLQVEQKLHQGLISKGGVPELKYPIYFFLGKNAQFEEHKSNVGYRINLKLPHSAAPKGASGCGKAENPQIQSFQTFAHIRYCRLLPWKLNSIYNY
jgi:hypothetical protein